MGFVVDTSAMEYIDLYVWQILVWIALFNWEEGDGMVKGDYYYQLHLCE